MRKRGRPAKNETKNNRIAVRLDDADYAKLTILAEKTDIDKSEIMSMALKMYYNLSKI